MAAYLITQISNVEHVANWNEEISTPFRTLAHAEGNLPDARQIAVKEGLSGGPDRNRTD